MRIKLFISLYHLKKYQQRHGFDLRDNILRIFNAILDVQKKFKEIFEKKKCMTFDYVLS